MNRKLCLFVYCGWLISSCIPATGCIIPYVYPKLSFVPGGNPAGSTIADLHAFRVDVTADQADLGETCEYTVIPISPRSDGSIPPVARVSVERGYYVLGIALNYNVGRLHTTRLRLYRPGFELVELESWDSADKIVWKPASDWFVQEKAVDGLLRRPAVTVFPAAQQRKAGVGLKATPSDPGFASSKETVLFVAAEYERVAGLATDAVDADRLRSKADQLRNPTMLRSSAVTGGSYTQPKPAIP